MGYCIDDLCHGGSPICGAASPHHCQSAGSGPAVDHLCNDDWCEQCAPWEEAVEATAVLNGITEDDVVAAVNRVVDGMG